MPLSATVRALVCLVGSACWTPASAQALDLGGCGAVSLPLLAFRNVLEGTGLDLGSACDLGSLGAHAQSPSPTPSPTSPPPAPPSPTPTPSQSPVFEQFVTLLDYHYQCSSTVCPGVSNAILDQHPKSTVSYTLQHMVRYHQDGVGHTIEDWLRCDVGWAFTSYPAYVCTRSVDPFSYVDLDFSLFRVFVHENDLAKGAPPWNVSFVPFPALTYPNPLDKPALSGLLSCEGRHGVLVRMTVEAPGPKWVDPMFGEQTMLRRDVPSPLWDHFFDEDGNVPDPYSPYKDMLCTVDA